MDLYVVITERATGSVHHELKWFTSEEDATAWADMRTVKLRRTYEDDNAGHPKGPVIGYVVRKVPTQSV